MLNLRTPRGNDSQIFYPATLLYEKCAEKKVAVPVAKVVADVNANLERVKATWSIGLM